MLCEDRPRARGDPSVPSAGDFVYPTVSSHFY